MELLSKTNVNITVEDVKRLCKDHINGPSAFSICRHGGEGEYKTLCSSIIEIGDNEITSHYIVNRFPCESEYKTLSLT